MGLPSPSPISFLCVALGRRAEGGNDLSTDDVGSLPAEHLVLPRKNFKNLLDSFLWKLFQAGRRPTFLRIRKNWASSCGSAVARNGGGDFKLVGFNQATSLVSPLRRQICLNPVWLGGPQTAGRRRNMIVA